MVEVESEFLKAGTASRHVPGAFVACKRGGALFSAGRKDPVRSGAGGRPTVL